MSRHLPRTRLDREAGLTLPELLVTMFLLSIIGSLVASLVTTFSGTITRERARMDSTNVAAIGMNELTRTIRAGTAIRDENVVGGATPIFLFAGRERLMLYAGLDTTASDLRPLQVNFLLDAARVLTVTRTTARAGVSGEADWMFTGSGTTTTSRPIARMVVPQAGSEPNLFTYRDEDGVALVPVGTASLSTDDMARIASVEVYLKVQADPTGRADPVVLTNRVGIPNIGLGQIGGTP